MSGVKKDGSFTMVQVSLAGLQRESAPALFLGNGEQLQRGESLIQKNRFAGSDPVPGKRLFRDVPGGGLFHVIEHRIRLRVHGFEPLQVVENGCRIRISLIAVHRKDRIFVLRTMLLQILANAHKYGMLGP